MIEAHYGTDFRGTARQTNWRRSNWNRSTWIAAACCLLSLIGCDWSSTAIMTDPPVYSVICTEPDVPVIVSGSTGDRLFAISNSDPTLLRISRCTGGKCDLEADVRLPSRPSHVGMFGGDTFLTDVRKGERRSFMIGSVATGRMKHAWDRDTSRCERVANASGNGRFVAVWASPDWSGDFDPRRGKIWVGLVESGSDTPTWITSLVGPVGDTTVSAVIPSNDGAFLAVAGWQHGAAVVDVKRKEVLWEKRPPEEICMTDAVFSPDNHVLYAGGNGGYVYGMDVRSGRILSRWVATPATDCGYSTSGFSISPDGRYLAVCTGPGGLVSLFATDSGRRVRVFKHAAYDAGNTCFSADSAYLASFGNGLIRVWEVPQITAVEPVQETK